MGVTIDAAHSLGRVLTRRRQPQEGPPAEEASGLRVRLYDAEGTDGPVSLADVVVDRLSDDQLLWVDVAGVEDLAAVSATFGLADETVAAVSGPSAEPDVLVYDGLVHTSLIAAGRSTAAHEPQSLHVLVGKNWVMTAHRDPIGWLAELDERIRADSELGRIDGNGFLAAILQEHLASYLAELRPIEAELDRIDARSMSGGRVNEGALLRELVRIRIGLTKLRRLLEPHRELYTRLSRSEFAVLSGSESVSEFEALTDFLERVLGSMEATREMIAGSFEIYMTRAAHGTNQLMKRLTIASVTLLPPTFLAGVMGMNSLPPVLATPGVFWVSAAVMCSLAVATLMLAWLRGWI
jgi:magnesium transporter